MPDDPFIPNQASNKEKAEGSREAAKTQQSQMDEADTGGRDTAEEDLEKQRQQGTGAGITNRPLDEEKAEQESLPARDTRKRGA